MTADVTSPEVCVPVSVALTCGGRLESLERALASLLHQTCPPHEVLILLGPADRKAYASFLTGLMENDVRIRALQVTVENRWQQMTSAAAEAVGEFFVCLDAQVVVPDNFIERCIAGFNDDNGIQLVSPRAEAFWNGRYWFRYQDYSDVGASLFERLGGLITLGFSEPDALDHLHFGVMRRAALQDCLQGHSDFLYHERFSFLYRLAELGHLHLARGVTVQVFNDRQNDLVALRDKADVRPGRFRWMGARAEQLAPMATAIWGTVWRSRQLTVLEKWRLLLYGFARGVGALVKGIPPRPQRF